MKRARIDSIVVAVALLIAMGGCGGGCGGCSGMEPIPGGFPAASRTANAGQVRVTQTAIDAITADPAGLIGSFVGTSSAPGVINFNVPGSCGGDPEICCVNGQVSSTCGPLAIDLNKKAGDADRLVITPVQGASRVDLTVRARVKTVMKMPVTYQGISCDISVDTEGDNTPPDLTITAQLNLTQDATAGTTRIDASNVSVAGLDDGDVSLSGSITCQFADAFKSFFLGTLTDTLASQVQDSINNATCKSCSSVADCAPFGTACTNGTCMEGNVCLQELGLAGRLRGSTLFASLSPGTTGAMDLYEVAGGYATTNNNGIALGLLGGMLPGGAPRDRCGPQATAPAAVTVAQSTFFQDNTRPDTAAPFDVGIGLHKSQLDQLAYAGYDGGLFCLTVGASTVSQLTTDTFNLLSHSLGNLVEGNSPMAIGLRPQSPPTITLGHNTFKDDGNGNMVPDEPLLDIRFQALELDFFASIDDQYNRVFTVVTDVHLPVNLQTTGAGELTPVLGNPDDAFTNISVKNSEALTESPDTLAGLFPTLLGLVVPQLSGSLSPFALPAIGNLTLSITDVTAVDNDEFLAIFANLEPAMFAPLVDTKAELASVIEPSTTIARDPSRWRTSTPPAVRLRLAATQPNPEYSWRVDSGSWSGWSTNANPLIAVRQFWLPGQHKVEVRARQVGHPETLDRSPVTLDLLMGTDVPLGNGKPTALANAGFHGQAGASGCSCQTSSPTTTALFALVLGALVVIPRRRRPKRARRLGAVLWATIIALLPGCSCGSNPCGDSDCLPGDIEHGAGGRWTSIAGDDKRVLVATYDGLLGDVVVVDATDPSNLIYTAVDGIPDETPTHDPDSYRGGIENAGPNVGAWTSVAISGGIGKVAYQDRDAGALKYAFEKKTGGDWENYVIDADDVTSGLYTSLVIDADGHPAVAYLAFGIDDGAGHRSTELRLARAATANPKKPDDWTHSSIAIAPGTCGGLCGAETCVVGAAAGDPQTCVSPTSDCTTACSASQACVTGTCRDVVEEPKYAMLPGGTGLYANLVVLPDGRLSAVYYDMTRRALVIASESAKGSNDFAETILDGNVAGADRGMWASAIVGDDGTVHVAYQDALGDELMYTTFNGAPGTPELVDDGQRTGDRTHPVGAGSSIYLDNGSPVIVYQDGMVSDVVRATRAGGAWAVAPIVTGPLLDGFSIAATTGHGSPVIAFGTQDQSLPLAMTLTVTTP